MLLIILAARELALFQEVWFIVIFPPVTMAVLALNLVPPIIDYPLDRD